ncbi:hypothetical protein B0H13DRAFT_51795 [Mycena leptocephala]|nr:hypothetical protein B0H13DRAFT_51795 [Mycena leptocephala]
MPNSIDIKSDPNRARRDLLDQVVAEVQSTESSRNATPVVEGIRSTPQVTPRPLNRERQSILTTVFSPLRPAHGTFQTTDNSTPQSGGPNMRRDIDSATEKPTQLFENSNVPDVLSEELSGEEKILPVFGPPLKSNSAASHRPSLSGRPHSPLISSPLGRTERKDEIISPSRNIFSVAPIRTSDDLRSLRKHESNPSFVGGIQIARDHGRIMNESQSVFPLNEESSGEEEIVLEAFSLPRNTPQGRTPMGHNPKAPPERTFRASPLIASSTPTLVHCPRPLKSWEQSDVHVKDSGRTQGNAPSPRKPPARGHPPFEYIRSGGRVSPMTPIGQSLWQQHLRRSPRGWPDRRPVSPTPPFIQPHQGTPRSFSRLAQHSMLRSAADRIQVEGLERMSSGEETFYGVSAR